MDFRLGDAAAIPLEDASVDLAIAFMSLQDVDAMPLAMKEVARILEPRGRFCLAIVHPINSAGHFAQRTPDSPRRRGRLFSPVSLFGRNRAGRFRDDLS
jgi:SAM-dependent methyltransferase